MCQSCDKLVTLSGCTPPLSQCQLRTSPAPCNPDNNKLLLKMDEWNRKKGSSSRAWDIWTLVELYYLKHQILIVVWIVYFLKWNSFRNVSLSHSSVYMYVLRWWAGCQSVALSPQHASPDLFSVTGVVPNICSAVSVILVQMLTFKCFFFTVTNQLVRTKCHGWVQKHREKGRRNKSKL